MKKELPKGKFLRMLTFTLFFDGLSAAVSALLPVAGQVINPILYVFAGLTLFLWLAFNGLAFQAALGGGGGSVVEVIPILQILPSLTLILVTIYLKNKIKSVAPLSGAKIPALKKT